MNYPDKAHNPTTKLKMMFIISNETGGKMMTPSFISLEEEGSWPQDADHDHFDSSCILPPPATNFTAPTAFILVINGPVLLVFLNHARPNQHQLTNKLNIF